MSAVASSQASLHHVTSDSSAPSNCSERLRPDIYYRCCHSKTTAVTCVTDKGLAPGASAKHSQSVISCPEQKKKD
ncbi:hypothetical protein CPB85DRAFT_1321610 [Mucidula mucida]|nr:hypothetical protein CPB85DRAFT_1321566 [Mucidula mucida]KAF8902501.1 hypothetical protein CPB85DRAFT_1321610 [Mucidula mucida]